MKFVVAGSGPSAVAAAAALVEHGLDVDMLDFGNEPEEWAKHRAASLRTGPTAPRSRRELAERDGPPPVSWWTHVFGRTMPEDVNWKRQFGSLFTFSDIGEYLRLTATSPTVHRSLAKGGLSNIWGAACYPFKADDVRDWPITVEDLRPHYAAVGKMLRINQTDDVLGDLYPIYGPRVAPLRLNPQCRDLLERWHRSNGQLRRRGFVFGQSRLAVLTDDEPGRAGCRYCGLCLSGCPYGSIYNSAFTVDELATRGNFRYRPGLFLRTFSETPAGKVMLEVEEVRSKSVAHVQCDGLFLGTGTLSSLRIVSDSFGRGPRAVRLLDNDMFVLPLVKASGWLPFDADVEFTLSQLVLAIRDEFVCREAIHTQLYSYNEFAFGRLRPFIDRLPRALRRAADRLLYNTFILAGYLHSDHSAIIDARVIPSRPGAVGIIDVAHREHPARRAVIRRALDKLAGHRRELGLIPVRWALKLGGPGFSGHLAGSLPMRRTPGYLETHPDGRLHGTTSVYVVDQSTFPTLPAQNPTYSAMANAHRIATCFARGRERETVLASRSRLARACD